MIDVTSFVKSLNKKPVAVYGLGLSGLATVRALVVVGAFVIAWDEKEERRTAAVDMGAALQNFTVDGFDGADILVLSPGVPLTHNPHPVVQRAQREGLEIIGDIEILHRASHGRETIGITGTNGKSTTTALIAHVLKACGKDIMVGGNIGAPVLEQTLPSTGGIIVMELSSYQIDLCPTFRPDIGVLLNIASDHLDRHGTMDEYAAAKAKMLDGANTVICSIDDKYCKDIFKERGGIELSVKNEELAARLPNVQTLKGMHNRQNMMAAFYACRACSCDEEDILKAMATYPGLPHRQFPVRSINGVLYINDSKATNVQSTATALGTYQHIYWIVGGRQKEGGLNGLEEYIGRIHKAFIIGEAEKDFSEWMEINKVPYSVCGTLDVAVLEAHAAVQANRGAPGGAGVVLLSPACASWDQYRSFEHRGETFEQLVHALPEEDA
jgi:UDP-N-acetylmuramoylalanine--D-glutamate ligase